MNWAKAWQNQQNHVCPAKTQISLGIRPVWSESLLSTWRSVWSIVTHNANSKYSDQTGCMPRLIWVFIVRTAHFVGYSHALTEFIWNTISCVICLSCMFWFYFKKIGFIFEWNCHVSIYQMKKFYQHLVWALVFGNEYVYHNVPKFSERQVWANSVDPD